jgi:hypothetical protein
MFDYIPDDWPNVKSLIQTSSEETKAWLEFQLAWLEEGYRSRVKIRLESKVRGETAPAAMGSWRGGGL